jgi:hypothetical protein
MAQDIVSSFRKVGSTDISADIGVREAPWLMTHAEGKVHPSQKVYSTASNYIRSKESPTGLGFGEVSM